MENRPFLPALQLFRGIAALMVVFHHLWHEIRYAFALQSPALDALAAAGKHGVDFFFVLSGFIICYAHFTRLGNRAEASSYLGNRILRIYIPYLPISICMLLAFQLFPSLSYTASGNTINWVKSITLLPLPGETALPVAWTLVFEMVFYLVFLIAFFSKRVFYIILGVWALAIVGAVAFSWKADNSFSAVLTSPYILEFIMGVFAAVLVRRLSPVHVYWVAAIIALPLVIGWVSPFVLHNNKVFLGLLFVEMILVAIHSPLNRLSSRNLLMIIGTASYSIYLVHNPAISLILRAFPKTGPIGYVVALTVFIFAFSCFVGVVYSRVFEVRLTNWVKNAKSVYLTRLSYSLNHRL